MDKVGLGAGLNFLGNAYTQEKQMEHDKEMAAINNQYMIDQWQRENEYNKPTAVAQRYRAAGINPRAAFGTGSASGAGIAGGLSSAPGSASTLGGYGSFAGLGANLLTAQRIESQNEKDEAEARLAEEKALTEYFERVFIKPHTARLESALADKGINEATIKKIQSQWAPYMADLESRLKEAKINDVLQGIKESKQRIIESEAITSLKDAERNLVVEQIKETAERVINYAVERDYKRALTTLTKNQSIVSQMESALKQAKIGHTESLQRQVNKEIEYIGKQMKLTDAQVKKWEADVKYNWDKLRLDSAELTSRELREWIFGWIPFT